jgi:hypothetical protein
VSYPSIIVELLTEIGNKDIPRCLLKVNRLKCCTVISYTRFSREPNASDLSAHPEWPGKGGQQPDPSRSLTFKVLNLSQQSLRCMDFTDVAINLRILPLVYSKIKVSPNFF